MIIKPTLINLYIKYTLCSTNANAAKIARFVRDAESRDVNALVI